MRVLVVGATGGRGRDVIAAALDSKRSSTRQALSVGSG